MRTSNLASLLAILCLLGTSLTDSRARCLLVNSNTRDVSKRICQECYRSKPNGHGCGPLLSASDKCLFYFDFPDVGVKGCSRCRPGYALKNNQCIGGTVQGCVENFYDSHQGIYECSGCSNGYAELEGESSVTSKCINSFFVQGAIRNCLWGGNYRKGHYDRLHNRHIPPFVSCFRCKPGYTLHLNPSACRPSTKPGCLALSEDGTRCASCDVYDGYSMQPDFTCLRVGLGDRRLLK